MKPFPILALASFFGSLALGGCGSPSGGSTPAVSSQERAQQMASDKSLPPQAQALAAQQNQSKSATDAMRAQDAKKAQ